jgi:UDP-glucose 6-dehydrogenase
MIHFVGTSFAARTLKEGARRRGLRITDNWTAATLIFVSEDTPTDGNGHRNLEVIERYVNLYESNAAIVLTSQVPPGFCRALSRTVYHQAETLRIEDGLQRAMYPEMLIVGSADEAPLPYAYQQYLEAFDCPVIRCTWEEAEFAKIAINMTLASQVDNANRLSAAAQKCGADWGVVANILRHDIRIGKYSYLTPGNWRKSPHLLRDEVTLKDIEK